MENITLAQMSDTLLFIVEFVGVIITIIVAMKKILDKQLTPIVEKIDKLDKNQCRNYLVNFLEKLLFIILSNGAVWDNSPAFIITSWSLLNDSSVIEGSVFQASISL